MANNLPSDSITYEPFSGKIKSDYNKVLGTGIYSVYEGTYEGKDVAIKKFEDPSSNVDQEISALMKLDHPNIVKMIAAEQDENGVR